MIYASLHCIVPIISDVSKEEDIDVNLFVKEINSKEMELYEKDVNMNFLFIILSSYAYTSILC